MEPLKTGYLTKVGNRVKTWHKRYFWLLPSKLCYAMKPNMPPKVSIIIADVQSVDLAPDCKKQPSFKLVTPERTFYCQGSSQEDIDCWITVIKDLMESRKKRKLDRKSKLDKLSNIGAMTSIKDEYMKLSLLGRGRFGKVMLVEHRKTKRVFALKSVIKKLADSKTILNERRILSSLSMPYLMKCTQFMETDKKIYMILPFCSGGTLYDKIKNEKKLELDTVVKYAAQIAYGLSLLEKSGYICRDFNPENILIDTNDSIVLTGFQDISCTENLKRSPLYMPPEDEYTIAANWWGLGVVIYEMISGIPAFYATTIEQIQENIKFQNIEFPSFLNFSEPAKDLIRNLLDKDYKTRLGTSPNDFVDKICDHEFFKTIDWNDIFQNVEIVENQNVNEKSTFHFQQEFLKYEPSFNLFKEESENADPSQNKKDHAKRHA